MCCCPPFSCATPSHPPSPTSPHLQNIDGFDVEGKHHVVDPHAEWVALPRPSQPEKPRKQFVDEVPSRRSSSSGDKYKVGQREEVESEKAAVGRSARS